MKKFDLVQWKKENCEPGVEKLFAKACDASHHYLPANKFNLTQFQEGLKVEKEHKDVTKGDPLKTAKIVMAHLKEVPDYYTKLKKVEKK